MPVTLNPLTGELDADVVDGNFRELEGFLKEGVKTEDFSKDTIDKFDKYTIRRHTSGKIAAFNTGSNRIPMAKMAGQVGTFENNWLSGTPEETFYDTGGDDWDTIIDESWEVYTHRSTKLRYMLQKEKHRDVYSKRAKRTENFAPLNYPYELLGYPGGSLHYEFQEQGFADPVSYFAGEFTEGHSMHGLTVHGWPPEKGPQRFPDSECWSRWLTIPHAAGGVYVDEPCVAVITAQVTGNYFFTPAMRVHGMNAQVIPGGFDHGAGKNIVQLEELDPMPPGYPATAMRDGGAGEITPQIGTEIDFITKGGRITEGMQYSASLRLGLFVDTNPVLWEDEFKNEGANADGFNPWIGSNPKGEYSTTRPSGVSSTRSWKKVTDISFRVRQRETYKVVGAVQLRGRRRYNFSLKFKPAMAYGYTCADGKGDAHFKSGYFELSESSSDPEAVTASHHTIFPTMSHGPARAWNHAWDWESEPINKTNRESYFYPGCDSLATNLIESSALNVEFFYGQELDEEKYYFIRDDQDIGIRQPNGGPVRAGAPKAEGE